MGASLEKNDKLRAWLDSEAGLAALKKFAYRLQQQLEQISLSQEVHPLAGAESAEERKQVCMSLIVEKTLEELSVPRQRLSLRQMLVTGSYGDFLRVISNDIRIKYAGLARKKDYNAFKFLVKKAGDAFRKHSDIYTHIVESGGKTDRWTAYSLEFSDHPRLATDDMFPDFSTSHQWPSPFEEDPGNKRFPPPSTDKFGAADLVELGSFFWRISARFFKGGYYLPVRNFIKYLSAYYTFLSPKRFQSWDGDSPDSDEQTPAFQEDDYQRPTREIIEAEGAYFILAHKLFDSLSDRQKAALLLVYFSEEKESRGAVAERLGMTAYYLNKETDALDRAMKKFPWEEVDSIALRKGAEHDEIIDDGRKRFLEELRKICESWSRRHMGKAGGENHE